MPSERKKIAENIIAKIDKLNNNAYEIRFSDLKYAFKLASQASLLSEHHNYDAGSAQANWNLSIFNCYLSKYDHALNHASKAKRLYKKCEDKPGEAKAIYITGSTFERMGDYKNSVKFLNAALKIQREVNDKIGESATLNKLGEVFTSTGEYEKAKDYLFDALALIRETGNKRFEAVFLNGIGILYRRLGDYPKALQYMTESTKLAREIGDEYTEGAYLGNIGNVYFNLNDYKRALECFKMSLAIQKKIKAKAGEANSLMGIGSVYVELKEMNKALDYFKKALDLKIEIGDKQGEGLSYSNIAAFYDSQEDYESSEIYHRKSLNIAVEIGDKLSEIQSLHQLGYIYLEQGRLEPSIAMLENALKKSEEIEAKAELFKSHELLSMLYEKKGDSEKAFLHFKKFHSFKWEVYNEEALKQTNLLTARFEIENTLKESEIYRLKNIELAKALKNVESLNKDLKSLDTEKNEFMGIVIHDLRNPLSNIFTSAALLLDEEMDLDPAEKKEIADYIKNSSEQMFELIKKLLDINAIESGKLNLNFEKLPLTEIIDNVTKDFAPKALSKNISIIHDLKNDLVISTDKTALELIINNLLSNAIKFSPPGKNIYLRSGNNSGYIYCEIEDEGPGFTKEDKVKVFNKFCVLSARPTGKESSNGLGLSIVKKLIEAIKGTITLQNGEKGGAKFIIKLPV